MFLKKSLLMRSFYAGLKASAPELLGQRNPSAFHTQMAQSQPNYTCDTRQVSFNVTRIKNFTPRAGRKLEKERKFLKNLPTTNGRVRFKLQAFSLLLFPFHDNFWRFTRRTPQFLAASGLTETRVSR